MLTVLQLSHAPFIFPFIWFGFFCFARFSKWQIYLLHVTGLSKYIIFVFLCFFCSLFHPVVSFLVVFPLFHIILATWKPFSYKLAKFISFFSVWGYTEFLFSFSCFLYFFRISIFFLLSSFSVSLTKWFICWTISWYPGQIRRYWNWKVFFPFSLECYLFFKDKYWILFWHRIKSIDFETWINTFLNGLFMEFAKKNLWKESDWLMTSM